MASVVVNQVAYDFYSLELEIAANGQSIGIQKGLDEIEYTVTGNREALRGSSRLPVVLTDGDAEFDGSLTIHRNWFHQLSAIAKSLGIGLFDMELTFTLNYAHKGEPIHTDTITGVKLKEIGNSHKRAPDPLMVTLPIDMLNIYFDGLDVFGNKLAA